MTYTSNNISLVRANYDTSAVQSGQVDEAQIDAYSNLFYPYIQDNFNNINTKSLTIDIINNNDNFINPEPKPEEKWIEKDRYTGNLLSDQYIWGFKETNHITKHSRALSNAFSFGGQKITFHIAKQGHLSGYIDKTYIYCKTTLNVSAMNVITGQSFNLYSFSLFETLINDSSRYFTWEIPSNNDYAFNQFGFFGFFVFKLEITNKLYTEANLNNRNLYTDHSNLISQNFMQLLTYSSAKEAQDVSADTINIFDSPPLYNDSWETLYNKSIFPSLASTNLQGLTDDQKRAIIADQIAVLFMSQHPVVTSDFYPSKILGFGAEQSVQPKKILQRAITYAQRYDQKSITMAEDRLFSIFASYKSFGFASEIENNFSNYNQSNQIIRDPVKCVYTDKNNALNDKIGVNGILFDPYALQNINSEVLLTTQNPSPIDFNLYYGTVNITNILATRVDDTDLQNGDTKVKVKFDIVYGELNIIKINYTLILANNTSLATYQDLTGLSRSHIFDFTGYGGVVFQLSPFIGDIAKIKIEIEDADGFINVFYYNQFLPSTNTYPAILDVVAFQRTDGSQMIDVYYQYQGTSTLDYSVISLSYSYNNSTFITVPSANIIGDTGNGILPGYKRISWSPTSSQIPDTLESIYVKLTLSSNIDGKTNSGITDSNIVVVERHPNLIMRKLSEAEQILMLESSSVSSIEINSSSSLSSVSSDSVQSSSSTSSSLSTILINSTSSQSSRSSIEIRSTSSVSSNSSFSSDSSVSSNSSFSSDSSVSSNSSFSSMLINSTSSVSSQSSFSSIEINSTSSISSLSSLSSMKFNSTSSVSSISSLSSIEINSTSSISSLSSDSSIGINSTSSFSVTDSSLSSILINSSSSYSELRKLHENGDWKVYEDGNWAIFENW